MSPRPSTPPLGAEALSGVEDYGPAKVACEDVLVPDDPDFPVAMIDVKDLAVWMVRCAERRLAGTFNATGPTVALRDALEAARRVAARTAAGVPGVPARAVPPQRLLDEGIGPWMGPDSLPWWIPVPRMRHTATAGTLRARENGLVCRPLEPTLADALAFEESRGGPVGAGLGDATERRIRASLEG